MFVPRPETPPTHPPQAPLGPTPTRMVRKDEKARLRSLEHILRRADTTGMNAALALYEIKTNKLFRIRGKTMKEYGQRWGYSPSHTSRLVACGKTYRSLELLWKEGCPKPRSVWQLRPLIRLSAAEQREVWRRASCKLMSKTPTAEQIESCIADFTGQPIRGPLRRKSHKLSLTLDRNLERQLHRIARKRGLSAEALARDVIRRFIVRADGPTYTKLFTDSNFDDLILLPQPNFSSTMISALIG